MANAAESLAAKTELGGDLAAGVAAISANQEITFTQYTQTVLPLDGYIFWVKANPLKQVKVMGSLHYASDSQQLAEESYTLNRVVFTSLSEIQEFNTVNATTLFIGKIDGIQFAFTSRGSFYKRADLYHYVGNAIYPDMSPQVVDYGTDLHVDKAIVSNSLPLWLGMNGYTPINGGAGFAMPVTMYPSFLSPQNIVPPFATIDIAPEGTDVMAAAPALGSDRSHSQLAMDRVKVVLWGLRNDDAMTFIDSVNAYSFNTNLFGIMNSPVIRDEKRTQSELNTIAQKKSVIFDISYNQYSARAVARQLIVKAQTSLTIAP